VPSEIEDERVGEVVADGEAGATPSPQEKWQYPPRKQVILDHKAQYIDHQ
jgi:hypothetical protein